MAWEFEDTGKTRICRNVIAPYNTWALIGSCVVTAVVGIPVVMAEMQGRPLPVSELGVEPLHAAIAISVFCFFVSFMIHDGLTEIEHDSANNTLYFRKASMFSSQNLRIPFDKIECLSLEKVTTKTVRKVAGAFQAKSEARKIGDAMITRKDFLSIRIAGGNIVLLATAEPHEDLEETARQISQFTGLHVEARETTKEESYTVNRHLGGKETIDFFS